MLPPALAGDERFALLCELMREQAAAAPLSNMLVYLVDQVPASILPYLAEQFSLLDEVSWSLADSESMRRALVKRAIELHRFKGTPWAIKQVLAAVGYPGSELLEHSRMYRQWLAAGGEFLDGSNTLDGSSDLSYPGAGLRFVTHHWAEYALRLNAVDGDISRARQDNLASLCSAYAPARSRLVAILLAALLRVDLTVRMTGFRGRGRQTLAGCRRITVPTFDTLDGCDLIGGETLPDLLDGIGTLDGNGNLVPERYTGEPLDGGQLGIRATARTRLCGTALGGNRQETPETLDSTDYLDGTYTIAGELLDGIGLLDGGNLHYPTLADHEDMLDGTSNLGEVAGPDHLWFSGRVRVRRGSTVTLESL
ncbi:Phage tail protein [compost metagenome]